MSAGSTRLAPNRTGRRAVRTETGPRINHSPNNDRGKAARGSWHRDCVGVEAPHIRIGAKSPSCFTFLTPARLDPIEPANSEPDGLIHLGTLSCRLPIWSRPRRFSRH